MPMIVHGASPSVFPFGMSADLAKRQEYPLAHGVHRKPQGQLTTLSSMLHDSPALCCPVFIAHAAKLSPLPRGSMHHFVQHCYPNPHSNLHSRKELLYFSIATMVSTFGTDMSSRRETWLLAFELSSHGSVNGL